ncbi:GNAT family N-acetyltransferase [Lacrimispora algidixylanolytica]|uniref:N-acetyltransferase domain-containing protein n=1 Tax=Lacrimispora algidixylanolytica TaxID=94868 RepID=A0A419STI0_9FIRM|nr:GNAT family protein [Lacrimispora algidixylanolytica]RKD28587.1 hypothetical protein BET01_10235 [Lacrimispora algidixylanolytica]
MNKISIKQLSLDDTNKLFDFEVENRSYFKTIGLSRSDVYYDPNSFQEILKSLVEEQEKGVATAAVEQVLRQANLVHKLHRIEAGTSPHNIGSQIVLTKNGFHFVGTYTQHISNGDDWTDSILFEKVID